MEDQFPPDATFSDATRLFREEISAFLTTGFTEIDEGIDHETTKDWDVTIGMFLVFSESKLLKHDSAVGSLVGGFFPPS